MSCVTALFFAAFREAFFAKPVAVLPAGHLRVNGLIFAVRKQHRRKGAVGTEKNITKKRDTAAAWQMYPVLFFARIEQRLF